jgi:hypothetical protein
MVVASNFSHAGLPGLRTTPPNLFEVPLKGTSHTAWVMSIASGAPLGGSIDQYFQATSTGPISRRSTLLRVSPTFGEGQL